MVDESARPQEPRVIKRYANRKLYDTRDSRYVTLLQIAEYVRGGEDVQIIDNNTKEDLTNVTLAQIIYEEEKKGEANARATAARSLRGFIQLGGERLMSTLREGPVGRLIPRRDGTSGSAPPPPASTPPPATDAEHEERRASALQKSKEALDELSRLADGRVRALISVAIAPVHYLQAEVRRLENRIQELETAMVRYSQKKPDGEDGSAGPPDKTG